MAEGRAGNASYKKLGIIGGLGPAATVYLYDRIVSLTDAALDQEHLDITILNRPQTPDRTAYLLGRSHEDFAPVVCAAARDLVGLGCEVICIPCMTSHAAVDEIERACSPARLLNFPHVVAADLRARGCRRVGILATTGTVTTGFLQRALADDGLDTRVPAPEGQELVESLIYDDVKAGRPADMSKFERACDDLAAQGCDSVILGCTELPLIHAPETYRDMYVADSLDILARAAITACGAPLR